MGEAKRKKQAYDRAKSALFTSSNGSALIVGKVAVSLFERFILPKNYTGGCYLTTMILHQFLQQEHNIHTEPVVGFVNDGTDNIFMSHAWLEHEGRKIDLTLHVTEHPDVQRPGALLVLDQELLSGEVAYSYHLDRPTKALAEIQRLRQDPEVAPTIERKEIEHQKMLVLSQDRSLMSAYIDAAPSNTGYAAMTALLPHKI